MKAVHRALLVESLAAALGCALAVCALVGVAALVEGRPPSLARVRAGLPLAAFLGVAWTLVRWRGAGGDLAVANAGARPLGPQLTACAGAVLLLLAAGLPAEAAPEWRVQTTADTLMAETPAGPVHIRWDDTGAHWAGVGTHPDLPRPEAGPPLAQASVALTVMLRGLALLGLLVVLRWGPPPNLLRALGGALAAFAVTLVA